MNSGWRVGTAWSDGGGGGWFLRVALRGVAWLSPSSLGPSHSLTTPLLLLLVVVLPCAGIEIERVRLPRSALLQQVATRLQERLISIAFAVLRNYGVFGSTSKVGRAAGVPRSGGASAARLYRPSSCAPAERCCHIAVN